MIYLFQIGFCAVNRAGIVGYGQPLLVSSFNCGETSKDSIILPNMAS